MSTAMNSTPEEEGMDVLLRPKGRKKRTNTERGGEAMQLRTSARCTDIYILLYCSKLVLSCLNHHTCIRGSSVSSG